MVRHVMRDVLMQVMLGFFCWYVSEQSWCARGTDDSAVGEIACPDTSISERNLIELDCRSEQELLDMCLRRGREVDLSEEKVTTMLVKRVPKECLQYARSKVAWYQVAWLSEIDQSFEKPTAGVRNVTIDNDEVEVNAMKIVAEKKFQCFRCGEQGHRVRHCPRKNEELICCNKMRSDLTDY
eukprot:Protomagalhaensia_wolfi_Nauph_80__3063@NODE_3135_length_879_cov_50_251190_g2458_i0_p1_GENE_NODE_3135_length_879_cov_50_251190_g2458_i0NODE_3135_length_879_cov_50_251190_g2458_i0_p1_ORF_typecomplete_len182_score18_39zfCCHC_2/PF13696_6/0_00019zfCCHC/PF00098_23/0_0024zfCCHC_4/PF14392_6/1_1e03zfCCHC_4/PF14392_6/0_0042PsaD/PF02531_16/0_42zfCCHC_3/PF13917_6/8_8_NODE_3135_length_879_cov_50_251190_g2458_i0186731